MHLAFDFLAATCEYDWDFAWPYAYDAYGALVLGSSACQGYSQAFMLLMQKLGIPCYVVYGVAYNGSDNVSHAWNMVQVDGSWYHVDVTWADLFDSQTPDSLDAQLGRDAASHLFLLCSDQQILGDRYWIEDSDMPHACPDAYVFDDFSPAGDPDASDEANSDEENTAPRFSDTPGYAWYTQGGYIDYVLTNGLMTGYSGSTLFGPEDPITRAQVATILYRYANPDSADTTDEAQYGTVSHFEDVPEGMYYTAAVEWCYQSGVVTGYDGTKNFGPDDYVTREQLATMLFRFAGLYGSPEEGDAAEEYPDSSSISSFAWNAMGWCRTQKILTGYSGSGNAGPQDNTTRAQMAKMITVLTKDVL